MADQFHEDRRFGRGRWVFWAFVLIAAYFLLTEHRAHVLRYLPYLLLLAAVLLPLFHAHRGTQGHTNGTCEAGTSHQGPKAASHYRR